MLFKFPHWYIFETKTSTGHWTKNFQKCLPALDMYYLCGDLLYVILIISTSLVTQTAPYTVSSRDLWCEFLLKLWCSLILCDCAWFHYPRDPGLPRISNAAPLQYIFFCIIDMTHMWAGIVRQLGNCKQVPLLYWFITYSHTCACYCNVLLSSINIL